VLVTDQGLSELTKSSNLASNTLKRSLISLSAGCLALSTAAAVMWMVGVTDLTIKVSVCCVLFGATFVVGLVYFFYYSKRQQLITACNSLSIAFQKDIADLATRQYEIR
jgi:formate/nitrite transporter FocA (FNT family)